MLPPITELKPFEKSPGPSPDDTKPYLWFDGAWHLLAIDNNDSPPESLREAYNPDEPRGPDGEWSSGSDSTYGHYVSGKAWPQQAVAAAKAAQPTDGPPTQPWRDPPVPAGKEAEAHGGGGMTAVGITNTKLGDAVENAIIRSGLGFTEAHPGLRQGPFDLLHGTDAYEVKAVTVDSTEYKAKPSAQAVADKLAFASEFGLTPHIMIVVYDKSSESLQMYSKEGVGAYRLSGPQNGWSYLGSAHLGKQTLGLAESARMLREAMGDQQSSPEKKSTVAQRVKDALGLGVAATAATLATRAQTDESELDDSGAAAATSTEDSSLLDSLQTALETWIADNAWRLDGADSVVWSGEQNGYSQAADEDNQLLEWEDSGLPGECEDCQQLAGMPPQPLSEWPCTPGDGTTECNVGCRCNLVANGISVLPNDTYDPSLTEEQQALLDKLNAAQADAMTAMVPDAQYLD